MPREDLIPVQVVVTLYIKPTANAAEVVSEMDYNFTHGDDIVDMEIREVNLL
jgi:hypothetical protein